MTVVVVASTVCLSVCVAAPAGAGRQRSVAAGPTATASTPDPKIDAIVALQSEVLALVELDAFHDPVPAELRQVHDQWKTSLNGLDRNSLVSWVLQADSDGSAQLLILRDRQYRLSPQIDTALGPLSAADVLSLQAGSKIAVSASVYAEALASLDALQEPGLPPRPGTAPATSPAGAGASTAAPTTAATGSAPPTLAVTRDTTGPRRDTTASPAGSSSTAGSDAPLWVVAGLVAALLAAGGWLVARRRWRVAHRSGGRRTRGVPTDDSVDHLLDVARRLSAAADAHEVARVAVDEAALLVDASFAAYVALDQDGPRVRHQLVEALDATQLDRGVIRRVLDTGHPARGGVVEPALGDRPVAVLAVPVLCSAQVVGALVVARAVAEPFGAEDQDVVCRVASLLAGALEAATRHEGITELSLTDGLTELANRRRLDRDLPNALVAGRGPVGFLMIDIDHFKTYNDTHGHVAGDEALRSVAAILSANVRPDDVVYRYGGEEFSVLLSEATPAEAALVAERIRAAVEAAEIPGGDTQPGGRLTVSVGLALTDRTDPGRIKERADGALYDAKHLGRNRVEIADD